MKHFEDKIGDMKNHQLSGIIWKTNKLHIIGNELSHCFLLNYSFFSISRNKLDYTCSSELLSQL